MTDHANTDSRGTVAELRALEAKASAAPWEADEDGPGVEAAGGGCVLHIQCHGNVRTVMSTGEQWSHADQRFVVALRNAAPALLDLAEEALERREIMRTLRCDITLAEAKALEETQRTTLQILKERGL